jgi:hypothetical protein
MNASLTTRTTFAFLLGLAVAGQIYSQDSQARPGYAAVPQTPQNSDPKQAAHVKYAGDDACASCHREKVAAYHRTAHYLSSALPSKESIAGDFTPGANVMKTGVPDLFFRMEQKEGGFFQTAAGIPPDNGSRTERFGLVIGSGGKGQTYLYWKGDRLFQLPVSYWREMGWINSPGYHDGDANFDVPVVPRCLECHATDFRPMPSSGNRYADKDFVVGITCEKCHGAGVEHVQREKSKPRGRPGSAILNPARFSRDRQIDLCAWCHGGVGTSAAPPFSYVPGEPLDDYIKLRRFDPNAQIDVHGDQVDLLRKSHCFQSSEMTCVTCHDVHAAQHDVAAFSQRCLNCHKPGTDAFPKLGHEASSNCIDCHMPKEGTSLIVFDWQGHKKTPQVRSHWIKTYPKTTGRLLETKPREDSVSKEQQP